MPLKLHHAHAWNLLPDEARSLQDELRKYVCTQPLEIGAFKTVGGVDVGIRDDQAHAAVVVQDFENLVTLDQATFQMPVPFPYVPGLLSFREAPAILEAVSRLKSIPDVLIVDGHGLAHPRRFGLACHLGVLVDLPAIGCAKSILVGEVGLLEESVGSTSSLFYEGEELGRAVRTRSGVKPVYLSVGHRVDLASATRVVLASCCGYRLPEPIRFAHRLASHS